MKGKEGWRETEKGKKDVEGRRGSDGEGKSEWKIRSVEWMQGWEERGRKERREEGEGEEEEITEAVTLIS